jgi:hypothetical protein
MEHIGMRMSNELIIKTIDDLQESPTSVPLNTCRFEISDQLLDKNLHQINVRKYQLKNNRVK